MATTPVDPRVVEQMIHYLGPEGIYGNSASTTHEYGLNAALAVERARAQVAEAVHAESQDIVFTSGATEANNLAIMGAAHFYQNKGKHLITMSTEHKSVLDCFKQLEKEGYAVTYLDPEPNGLLDLKKLEQALRTDTILVSIMHVNNEIGVIQDINAIGTLLRNKGIIFHVDAAQSGGKIVIDLSRCFVDLLSLSAHKNYGPKGIGALYVRHKPRIRLQPQTFGGGQEGGVRSGTLATHQIVGMGEAFHLSQTLIKEEQARILSFRRSLWQGIRHLPGIGLNGDEHQRVANILNFYVAGLDGDSLLLALHELALSTTSACSSSSIQPSYVLRSMGLSDDLAQSSIRLSLGRYTTANDVAFAIQVICTEVTRLREIAQS